MALHPINQANENSPFGDLTREQFLKKHQILHQESYMFNKKNMKIFHSNMAPRFPRTSQRPRRHDPRLHQRQPAGISELTAVTIAKTGFLVCALDLQGHGSSDGYPGHIPNIEHIVQDCIQFFDSVKTNHPKLPSFLYGESLGGAISILICLEQKYEWDGLILSGSMCGVSAKFKPMWPLEKLLPVAALFAPKWKVVVSKPVASKSYKEEWKRRLVARNPNRRTSGKPPAATALEFLEGVLVYESAASEDKTLKIFPGLWHMLIGENEEDVEVVFGIVLSWIAERAGKAKAKSNIN
ncbi:hypothetical protein Patl1_11415 [Pistacia atlantica]|uniref:Uncharacterized protein n=1 Tax=Pistacia atlantica TaxID=434234 RepID=A0ACC1A554_9ROSI|nr:hypothetical protein Patl1_11415 [Pistacia atlantica]